jgi:uncharacterized membrane protein YeaQ/YmgE (transglycosylase-associated protein family)
MDIAGILTNVISGAIGGNAIGAALKDKSLGTLGNTIAGVVGGAAGGYILQAVGMMQNMGLADMTVSSLLSEAGAGVVGGAVLTAIIGYIKGAMKK